MRDAHFTCHLSFSTLSLSIECGFLSRYDAALALAARAHRDQLRKGTDLPYIAHPVHVSIILIRHGFGEDLTIAGLLHDVVEDTDTSLDTDRGGVWR